MTGYPLHVRLAGQDWVISGTPSEVTAELMMRQDPPADGHLVAADGDLPRDAIMISPGSAPGSPAIACPFRDPACGVTNLVLWRW